MAEEAQDGMNDQEDSAIGKAGYGRPPQSTRFQKGRSGNPRGRPRGRQNEIPYDSVLGQMVTIREDGRERRVTAAEAFLLQLTQKGLAGDNSATRASMAAIEEARGRQPNGGESPLVVRIILVGMGIGCVLLDLGLAIKTNPLNEKRVRWWLKPWLVEAALSRLGDRRLTAVEQREVWNVIRKPETVNWPDWWTVRG
jgi:hypothetical protein